MRSATGSMIAARALVVASCTVIEPYSALRQKRHLFPHASRLHDSPRWKTACVFSKILVANRGEIAIRAFRAAYELGAQTVAVFPYEDRNSEHRLKADEAYQIGEPGHPVRAYLDPRLIVETAVKAGADAVYPGYGFLSENPALAEACASAGIAFVGPDASVLALTGNKARAIAAARAAGIPILKSTAPGT